MSKSVLLIEDDFQMQELIADYLNRFDFKTYSYQNPQDALDALFKNEFDVDIVILDLMLPQMDGFDVAKIIKEKLNIPIIISSARADLGNKIYGYEIGVDDYLAKPYEPRELVLRMEAVLRRYNNSTRVTKIAGFEIDGSSKSVSLDEYEVDFTKIEFEIFLFLVKNRGKNVSREQIINATSLEFDTKNRTIDMHISNIRQKIGDDAKEPKYIKSLWGIGYKFIG